MKPDGGMRLCFFGTYDREYSRNQVLAKALETAGIEVVECHETLWGSSRDKYKAAKGARLVGLLRRLPQAYRALRRRHAALGDYDVMLTGYLGHLDMFLASRLAAQRGRPLAFDSFISLYDTVVCDRRLFSPRHPAARALHRLDTAAFRRADLLLTDTLAHAAYFQAEFGVDPARCHRLWVGADEKLFHPREDPCVPEPGCLEVLFYGTFSNLQGIEYILKAADLLKSDADIRFTLVGSGQLREQMQALARKEALANVRFLADWVAYEELPVLIHGADVCLGIFGTSDKAGRVIPNKVFQCMAMGKPVITADTVAARELLDHERNALLCRPGDPPALADAIRRLRADHALQRKLSHEALTTFQTAGTTEALGGLLRGYLTDLLAGRAGTR